MDELNELLMAVKIHSGVINQEPEVMAKLKTSHPMWTNDEINRLHHKINEVLRQDSSLMKKY